jgi:hypothetical protein
MRAKARERLAAREQQRVRALAEFHDRHRCCECGEAADVFVITPTPGSSVTRKYCTAHAPQVRSDI